VSVQKLNPSTDILS